MLKRTLQEFKKINGWWFWVFVPILVAFPWARKFQIQKEIMVDGFAPVMVPTMIPQVELEKVLHLQISLYLHTFF